MYAVSFGQENITCNHEGYQACCMLLHELGLGGTHHPRNVVVSNIFYFYPYLGRSSNLTNIFQMGSNHQPDDLQCIYGT